MNLRKCRVFVDETFQEAFFHQFGTEIIYGSDNEPREATIAVVELKDGRVMQFPPEKVKFLDQPE